MNKYEGGGTLKTMGWATHNGIKTTKEILVDLDKIICVAKCDDDIKGDTCLISVTDSMALHIDIPLDQMRKILDEHKKHPYKNFDTHSFPEDFDEKPKKSQKRIPKK